MTDNGERKDAKIEPVFLNNGNIIEWKRPPKIQRRGLFYVNDEWILPDALTELKDCIGINTVDEDVGNYRVIASAVKYNAGIAKVGDRWGRDKNEPLTNPVEDMILFAGTIGIYTIGEIPGTNLQGYDFLRHGEIWTARKPLEEFRGNNGLRNLIFENSDGDKAVERIASIIRGYEDQELGKERIQEKRVSDEYHRGAADHHEATFGTFSRVPLKL